MKRTLAGVFLLVVLLIISVSASKIQLAKAQNTAIYINPDGSITPSTANITTFDDVTYTFTGNVSYPVYYGIVVDRSNIVIDGNGYTVRGASQNGDGLNLNGISNVTVKNTNTEGFFHGIYLLSSSNNILIRNTATTNSFGIYLNDSSYNTISGNMPTANTDGIFLLNSSNNNVSGNSVTSNNWGLVIRDSSNNTVSGNDVASNSISSIFLAANSSNDTIFHNNFVGNVARASVDSASVGNAWEGGYPSGGNYWSDYNGTDLYNGAYQNVSGSDGIGDTPYVIDANNIDYYPLMNQVVISEFQPFMLLPLFSIVTLLTLAIYAKKKSIIRKA